jgi:hypothetical protein
MRALMLRCCGLGVEFGGGHGGNFEPPPIEF